MKFSVVINTYNRARLLRQALHSLDYQDYDDFEVVVVDGPSTDGTDEVIAEYAARGAIKAGKCPERNLSISRNIGISMTAGDVVAFMDDDAVPERGWLSGLARTFKEHGASGVGGPVYNN